MGTEIAARYGVPVHWVPTRGAAWYRAKGLQAPRGGSWHDSGEAFDVAVDPNTPLGRRIAADLRAKGFGVLTALHGTGPHIHVSPNGR